MSKYLIVVEETRTGYSASSPDLPGCVATGDTKDEVERTMQEAIETHLEGLKEEGEPVPVPHTYSNYAASSELRALGELPRGGEIESVGCIMPCSPNAAGVWHLWLGGEWDRRGKREDVERVPLDHPIESDDDISPLVIARLDRAIALLHPIGFKASTFQPFIGSCLRRRRTLLVAGTALWIIRSSGRMTERGRMMTRSLKLSLPGLILRSSRRMQSRNRAAGKGHLGGGQRADIPVRFW